MHKLSRLIEHLPHILRWIDEQNQLSLPLAKPTSEYALPNLAKYFSNELLSSTKAVPCEVPRMPPVASFGLTEFSDLENMSLDGITFKDYYYVKPSRILDEALHFHELVHVLQWKILGPERFLLTHGQSLMEVGYRQSYFERMAYDHASRFSSGVAPYNVEDEVRASLAAI